MESYDKSVELKLVTWKYHEYGVWKNFEDNPSCKGDNVVLEQGFQAGRKTLTLQHGWYETVRSFSLSLSLSLSHTHTHREKMGKSLSITSFPPSQGKLGGSEVPHLPHLPFHTKNIDIDRSSIANRPKSYINSI